MKSHALSYHVGCLDKKDSQHYVEDHWIRGKPTAQDRREIDRHVTQQETGGVPTAPDGGFGW